MGGVLNITAAAWTAGFQWWRSGDITRMQNASEYMLVLALCLVQYCITMVAQTLPQRMNGCLLLVYAERTKTAVSARRLRELLGLEAVSLRTRQMERKTVTQTRLNVAQTKG